MPLTIAAGRRTLLALLVALGMGAAGGFPQAAAAACVENCFDMNGCGTPGAGCVYSSCTHLAPPWGTQTTVNRHCCAPGKRQWLTRRWFDCNGDGVADCETRLCFVADDDYCFFAEPQSACP
jgi:hypothetical protein